jgi:hypothetical protein
VHSIPTMAQWLSVSSRKLVADRTLQRSSAIDRAHVMHLRVHAA